MQLVEDGLRVAVIDHFDKDVDLLQLDIEWVIKFAEEDLDVVVEDLALLLQNEADVAKGNVLQLRFA